MALDGFFINRLRQELSEGLQDTRVEKIYQPSRDELIFVMRRRGGEKRLFISARADSPRVHFIRRSIENPAKPPMLCMLLRKLLGGAKFISVEQVGLDRILHFRFLTKNEMGDDVVYTLAVEIMGKYSNIVLIAPDGKIVDALKRINESKSSVREVLPGGTYVLPPKQDKLNLLSDSLSDVYDRIVSFPERTLSQALISSVEGASKLICNELVYEFVGEDKTVGDIGDRQSLISGLAVMKNRIMCECQPTVLYEVNKPKEFYFLPIRQYGSLLTSKSFDTLSELLEDFYYERDRLFRTKQRAQLLSKTVSNAIERISRKLSVQTKELENTENAEKYKICGELIAANAHALQKGMSRYELLNYYTGEMTEIQADPLLTPAENSQKYYKKYKKFLTAKVKLSEEIKKGEEELEYLKSVEDLLSRSSTFEEMSALKAELTQQGFIKIRNQSARTKSKKLAPFEYKTSGGFTVLVGRNNLSNDTLTLTIAGKNDIWFHTKLIHGSHTVLFTQGREVDENSVYEAAKICAYHSKGRQSSNVPVDYTQVKNVKKPNGAKPGFVIYDSYNTVYVTPVADEVEKLKV